MLVTCIYGDNSDLIREVAALYLHPGNTIADVTYGKGVFWRQVDLTPYTFKPTDIYIPPHIDFRSLPYEAGAIDVLVLDPPYMHDPGHPIPDYNSRQTTKGMSHNDIVELYKAGIKEAYRVLDDKGTLWIKCADEISSGKQFWTHIELYNIAKEIGFVAQDLFILHRKQIPILQIKTQQHARKNHSYLWVFK